MTNIIVQDFVCGTKTDTGSEYRSEYAGETYYFCSHECRDKFNANPQETASIAHDSLVLRS